MDRDVVVRLDFRVNHSSAAANAMAMTSQVNASRMPPTTALSPVAWAGSLLTVPLMIGMANQIPNTANERNIARPVTLSGRMFYSWILQRRVNLPRLFCVKITTIGIVMRCVTSDGEGPAPPSLPRARARVGGSGSCCLAGRGDCFVVGGNLLGRFYERDLPSRPMPSPRIAVAIFRNFIRKFGFTFHQRLPDVPWDFKRTLKMRKNLAGLQSSDDNPFCD